MKARILDNAVVIHLSMDESSPVVQNLTNGSEVDLGRVLISNNIQWVEVMEGTFLKGFIKGDTKVYFIKKLLVDQDEVIVYDLAAPTGIEKARYIKGTVLFKTNELTVNEQGWIEVKDENGNSGFVHKEAALKDAEPPAPAAPPPPQYSTGAPGTAFRPTPEMQEAIRNQERTAGKNQMLWGGLMAVAGCVVTAVTFSAATSGSGGYYLLCWGPVIFGIVAFFQGLSKYNKNK